VGISQRYGEAILEGDFTMKRKLFSIAGTLAVLLASGLVLAGCATSAGRYDNSSPPELDSVLVIGKTTNTMVTRFDNQTVSWAGGKVYGIFDGSYTISVPSGEHMLTGGLYGGNGNLLYETSTNFNFVAGQTYSIDVISRNFRIQVTTLNE
jgi:hypothetical protein